MHLWSEAMDELTPLEARDDLTVDQRMRLLEIKATLSVAQEISTIRDAIAQRP